MPSVIVHPIRLEASPNIKITGGPNFSTVVTRTPTGWRYAQQDWPYALWKLKVRYIRKDYDFSEILAFFLARRGPAYAFLVRDPLDHTDGGFGSVKLVNGVYRLVKTYPDDINPYERLITRPVEGTVDLSGVPGTPVLDYATGIVTGASGPGPVTFHFDIPVAFMKDAMDYDYSPGKLVEWMDVDLEEVRVG